MAAALESSHLDQMVEKIEIALAELSEICHSDVGLGSDQGDNAVNALTIEVEQLLELLKQQQDLTHG